MVLLDSFCIQIQRHCECMYVMYYNGRKGKAIHFCRNKFCNLNTTHYVSIENFETNLFMLYCFFKCYALLILQVLRPVNISLAKIQGTKQLIVSVILHYKLHMIIIKKPISHLIVFRYTRSFFIIIYRKKKKKEANGGNKRVGYKLFILYKRI